MHIHDNHVDYDEHIFPGMGIADWDDILSALVDINYSGDFTLEVVDISHVSLDFLPTVAKFAQQSGRYLANRLDSMLIKKSSK